MARLIDSRRLTGRNLLLEGTGAGAELDLDDADDNDVGFAALIAALTAAVAREGARVDLSAPLVVRRSGRHLSLALAAPIDALLTAAEMLETAIVSVVGAAPVVGAAAAVVAAADEKPAPLTLEETRASERNDLFVALVDEATRRGVPTVSDDEGLTAGLGARGQTWPLTSLPTPPPWSALATIPVALVTGTNGKTTTTRLLASILRAAGFVVGATSTDGVVIDGVVVEDGDWSGPGGARRVLRDRRVTAAVLETARGGLLRRGLALTGYDVAVVTNVAADHLGEFGIDDLDGMAEVKCLVARGLKSDGTAVLNASDPRLMAQAATMTNAVALFGNDLTAVRAHATDGQACFGVVDIDGVSTIARACGAAGGAVHGIVAVAAVPLCFGGAAGFNVENAAAAAAAATSMGIADDMIARGLCAVSASFLESAGRANVVEHGGVTVVVDFAHNAAAMAALWSLIGHLVDTRRARGAVPVVRFSIGAPGDRLDAELLALADAIAVGARKHGALATMTVICRELCGYLRGRFPGATPTLLADRLRAGGVGDVAFADDDVSGLRAALQQAQPGDIVVLTPVVDQAGIAAVLGMTTA